MSNFCTLTGSVTNFTLSIRPARNYPLDLYILTDLSYSFNDDLANLKKLGTTIGNDLHLLSALKCYTFTVIIYPHSITKMSHNTTCLSLQQTHYRASLQTTELVLGHLLTKNCLHMSASFQHSMIKMCISEETGVKVL